MMGAGWAHFSRDLRTEMQYEGLVIDVRANGGGEISQLVLEKLADQNAGSDGDIITAAIKLLGLGPVVGTRKTRPPLPPRSVRNPPT
jgi:tricorn protease